MPRKRSPRRFEARYGVGQEAIEVEAQALSRELQDYLLLSLTDLEAKRVERDANCRHDWQRLSALLNELPDRERKCLQAMFFRDVYLLLELYLCLVGSITPRTLKVPPARTRENKAERFDEFLFEMEGHHA